VTQAISNLIRDGKTFQIGSMMRSAKSLGMIGLNDALMELVTKNRCLRKKPTPRRWTRLEWRCSSSGRLHPRQRRNPSSQPRDRSDLDSFATRVLRRTQGV